MQPKDPKHLRLEDFLCTFIDNLLAILIISKHLHRAICIANLLKVEYLEISDNL